MTSQPPPGFYQVPPSYTPYPPVPLPGHRAGAQPRRRSRRAWFWVFAAWHLLVILAVTGAGKNQSDLETFSILGSGAAVDVMIVAGMYVWKATGRQQ